MRARSLTCRRGALTDVKVGEDDVPDAVATAYDRHVALQCARRGAGAWFEPTPLARYRVHPGSDTATAETRQALGSLAATEHALQRREHVDPASLTDAAQWAAVTAARLLLREGQVQTARLLLHRGMRRWVVRALRTGPAAGPYDPAVGRLMLTALLPARLATRVARRRWESFLASPAAAATGRVVVPGPPQCT